MEPAVGKRVCGPRLTFEDEIARSWGRKRIFTLQHSTLRLDVVPKQCGQSMLLRSHLYLQSATKLSSTERLGPDSAKLIN